MDTILSDKDSIRDVVNRFYIKLRHSLVNSNKFSLDEWNNYFPLSLIDDISDDVYIAYKDVTASVVQGFCTLYFRGYLKALEQCAKKKNE